MITILVMGAGGAVPTPSRSPAAYWVTVDERTILLDPGPGALVRLMKSAHGPDSIDAIETVVLSHLHIDHVADLAPLLFALHSPVPASERPLHLFGPPGLHTYLARLGDLYGRWLEPAKRELRVEEIEPSQVLYPVREGDGYWRVGVADEHGRPPLLHVFAADHPQDRFSDVCLCYRFGDRQGRRLVYSGDTGPSAGLTAASRGADLLVVECSAPDDQELTGHLSPRRVGALCAEAGVHEVVLTHMYPRTASLDPASRVSQYVSGTVTAAVDDSLFVVPDAGGDKEDSP